MKKRASLILLFSLAALITFAQDITFPELEGFKKVSKYPVYKPENLWDFNDGAADAYLALGFAELHVIEYKKGREVIKAEIYRHSDHTSAFGIYSAERSPSFDFLNLGAQGYRTGGSVNFFKGNYYVKIRTFSEKPKTLRSEDALSVRIAQMLTGETDMPALLSSFPDEGKKKNEETYISESVLGHQFLSKAFRAVYEAGNDKFSIYLMKLKSASEASACAASYLKSAGIDTENQEAAKYAFTDGYNGTIFLSWKDNIVVVISGLAKDQADIAEKYTSSILK